MVRSVSLSLVNLSRLALPVPPVGSAWPVKGTLEPADRREADLRLRLEAR